MKTLLIDETVHYSFEVPDDFKITDADMFFAGLTGEERNAGIVAIIERDCAIEEGQ